jgi:hypothetical protein
MINQSRRDFLKTTTAAARQTKEAATDMFYLKPPRHISTLPSARVIRVILVVGRLLPVIPSQFGTEWQ